MDQLHRRAARWFAAEGMLPEAIEHALAAGDWEHAATLLVEGHGIGHLMVGPAADTLAIRFADLPTDVTGPEAAVVRAALALAGQDSDLACKHLACAREWVPDGSTHRHALELAIAVTEAICAHARGDIEDTLSATAAAQAILTEVQARAGGARALDLRALLLTTKGSALMRADELERAGTVLTEGLRVADEACWDYVRMRCLGDLALFEALRGQLRRAARFARTAEATADSCELPLEERPPTAAVVLAWVYAEACEPVAARRQVDRAAKCRGAGKDPVSVGMLALVRARLLRARGDLNGAVNTLEQQAPSRAPATPLPGWLRDLLLATGAVLRLAGGVLDVDDVPLQDGAPRCGLALAAARLAAGESAAAIEIVTEILQRAGLPLDVRVEGLLLVAEGELARERTASAQAALGRALALAAPQTLRRPVVEASPRLRGFLRQEHDLVAQHEWLRAAEVVAPAPRAVAVPAPTCAGPGPLVEPLTERETEVLLHLATLLSTEEIARKMFISVNTVKTHIRGIFRKLAVSRRNDAIRRARDLGLV